VSLLQVISKPDVRRFLDGHISKPDIESRRVLIVPPRPGANGSVVGTALDYVLRFGMRARHGGAHPPTIAEQAVKRLDAGHYRMLDIEADIADRVRVNVATARACLDALTPEPLLTREVAMAALRLACVDPLYRAGRPEGLDREPDDAEVDDLTALYRVVPWEDFAPRDRWIANPTFGEGSVRIHGADGDLIVDDRLIDFKCTKETLVEPEAIRQVVCYALLANRFGVDGVDGKAGIYSLGIYMARTRRLYTFKLRECINSASDSAVVDKILSFSSPPKVGRRPRA
jgi:hypothetical protein